MYHVLDVINYMAHGLSRSSSSPASIDSEVSMPGLEGPQLTDASTESLLDRYTVNLNEKAKEGKIDPVIGREQEITRAIQNIVSPT